MIKPKLKLKVEDKRLKALAAAVKGMKNMPPVYVGVHPGAGSYKDGTTVAEVAWWNEFGTDNAPERPFLRPSVYQNQAKIAQWRKEILANVVAGRYTANRGLNILGYRMQALVVATIDSNVPPENAPSTKAAKRAAGVAQRTLIFSGLLRRSISYSIGGDR